MSAVWNGHVPGVSRRPSVGFVVHDAGGVGGMERQVEKVATGLADRGYPVTVYATTCAFAAHPGIRWIPIRGPRRPVALRLPWFALVAGLRLARGPRPDVLFTTGAIVATRTDYAVLHFCHHAYAHLHGRRPGARAHMLWSLNAAVVQAMALRSERWLYRRGRCRALVAVSPDTAEDARRYLPGPLPPVLVVENGVDTQAFSPDSAVRGGVRAELGLSPEDRLLLFVGGDWALKRLRLAIAALAHAPRWRLAVVGGGDIAAYTRAADFHGVGDRVHFFGRQSDPRPYFRAADAFVHPSRSEALPLVMLEACSSGLGVVTTLQTSLARELASCGAAVLVDADPEAIGHTLSGLGATTLAEMGRRAREAAKPRDWKFSVDGFEALIAMAGDSSDR